MGLSAVVPVIHGLKLYGLERMIDLIGLPWLSLQGILYLAGAAIYAVCDRALVVLEDAADVVHRQEFLNDCTQVTSTFGGAHIRFSMWL